MNCIKGVWSGSAALPRRLSWLAFHPAKTKIPCGLTLVPVPATGAAPRPTDTHFTPSEKAILQHCLVVGDGKGSHFMHLLPNALHLTLQARYLHWSGCHVELMQLSLLLPIEHSNAI
jgi:hypothetical protein